MVSKREFWLFFVILAGAAGCSGASRIMKTKAPGVTYSVDTSFYAIQGSTVNDLRAQIRGLGPEKEGRKFDAYTEYEIEWRYKYRMQGKMCSVGSAETFVKITLTLPRWEQSPNASQRTRNLWRDYFENLMLHEKGHMDLAIQAAEAIVKELKAITPTPSCELTGQQANTAGRYLMTKLRQQQADYDRQTEHGVKQGAQLLPLGE